ncbi:MAG: hypothetical protein JO199_07935 [Candidatus Eremiobacteraeota bacterium]|nr:hypothetical protein [Candidatus Eremiobacteraeota bacterium]
MFSLVLATAVASIPLHVNTGNKVGYNIAVSVGGGPERPVLFDTGSTGLWIYPDAIGKDYTDTGIEVQNRYPSGITYDGTLVYATVDFGNGLKTAKVPVELVRSAGCYADHPICPAQAGGYNCPNVRPGPNAGIECLEAGRGLYGHLGGAPWITPVGTSGHDIFTVLLGIAQPWASSYVVTPGAIEFGVDTSSFTKIPMKRATIPLTETIPSGALAWMRTEITLCYTLGNAMKNECLPTYFDTGASYVEIQGDFNIPLQRWECGRRVPSGMTMQITLPDGTPFDSFQTGDKINWNTVIHGQAGITPSIPTLVNLGLTPFNRFEILFDDKNGYVGFKPLAAPASTGESGCGRG